MLPIEKRIVALLGLLGLVLNAGSALAEPQDFSFQLVETWPVEVELLDHKDIPDAAPTWKGLFEEAHKSIDLAQFYISNEPGEILEPLVSLIRSKATAGVPVRFLVDKKMTPQYPEMLDVLRSTPGVSLSIYDIDSITHGIHHAKYFCVNEASCYIGSQNFDWRSLKHIHELGVLVRSKRFADELRRVFAYDWDLANGKKPVAAANAKPEIYSDPANGLEFFYPVLSPATLSPGGFKDGLTELVSLIDAATSSIQIEVMTYSPLMHKGDYDDTIDRALRRAASRKVKVTLLVSHWNLRKPAQNWLKSLAQVPNITVKVSTIPAYSKGFIPHARVNHAKYALFDQSIAWVGTSNWSCDYFLNSRDLELVFKDKTWVPRLIEKFAAHEAAPFVQLLDPGQDYAEPVIK